MDKFNIIEPKDSIAALDYEMNQWLQLPTDFKFISNDDCLRLHGCTVPQYYNRLRLGLMNAEDNAGAYNTKSNIMSESVNFGGDGYKEKLAMTAQVSINPYIVIITPETSDIDYMYNNYLNLSAKNRRLSDYYSVEIWGVNVRNMYEYLKSEESDAQSTGASNLSIVANAESIADAIYDAWNKVTLEHSESKIKEMNNIVSEAAHSGQTLAFAIIDKGIINAQDPDKLFLPRYCPWFTLEEMAYMNIDSNFYNRFNNNEYREQVIEAYNNFYENNSDENREAVLELGWNPHITPNKDAFNRAKERQSDYLEFDFMSCGLDDHKDIKIKVNDDKISIAFPGNLEKLYTPWFNNNGSFVGYSQSVNSNNKDLIAVKMDPELYKNLEKRCKQIECPDKSKKGYNNGLTQIIMDPVNKLDLDYNRVKEACIIDLLYKLSTIGIDEKFDYPSITF